MGGGAPGLKEGQNVANMLCELTTYSYSKTNNKMNSMII